MEQNPSSAPAGVQAILSDAAGSGLAGSSQVLTVAIASPDTAAVSMGDYEVPAAAAGGASLKAVNMVNGVVVCTLTWSGTDAYFAHRVAFSATGAKTWDRTDNDNHNYAIGATTEVLPALNAEDLAVGEGTVVFGVDDQYVAVDAASGDELYRAAGPYSAGLAFNSGEVFGVDEYTGGGYGNGISVFRLSDGAPFGVANASGVTVDPVSGLTAASYQVTDTLGANEAPNLPGTPAIEVFDKQGQTVFTVDRAEAEALGQPNVVSAFDGRMIVRIDDGIRVVSMTDGEAEAGFETVPPGAFRLNNVPIVAGMYLTVLAETNGYGEMEPEFAKSIVVSDGPLTWADLEVALIE